MYKHLDKINSPEDVKKLNYKELDELCTEIRNYIIEVVSKNGGHLASNLGVIELTLALHRVFDSPKDKIIWDVGHQCYVHKIITGRRESFKTLRSFGGISGFPKTSESPHDIFNTGHSSTSISAALGMAKARDLKGEDYSIVAVIGDGSLGGGMALEALNNVSHLNTNIILILNDNEMSISKNVGGLSTYLGRLRTGKIYFKFKNELEFILNKIPIIGKNLYKIAAKCRDWFKYLVVKGIMFEELGFKYLGPIDGHDIKTMEKIISRAKNYKKHPVLIHVITKKGNGYKIAEDKPEKYHGVGPFLVETGESLSKNNGKSYSSVFGDKLIKLAQEDKRIVAITAAMPEGTGLSKFAEKFKDRFFDVGIAEQHAVTFSAGLAKNGFKPIFAVYSTFLQRAYDQVLHDICLQNLPVIFAIDRAGLVGQDGETHQGVYDISYLRSMPNITIMSPKSGSELEKMLEFALHIEGPVAIRYPRGEAPYYDFQDSPIEYGKGEVLFNGKHGIMIAEGTMIGSAIEICEILKKANIYMTLVNIRFIKPIDKNLLDELASKSLPMYTLEDNVYEGGLGSSILEYYSKNNKKVDLKIFAHENGIITHGSISELLKLERLDTESICNIILSDIKVDKNDSK
ncbi:1-deoxy-D-xylulose-5-phosphate synthase [Lutispora thermophila]|uniref:1-deoxy-D-xylulose-5-phosphate synthase n=1 Tax=Lutispora thermophila DSM 19022 TaxID=1122184 RepID=A0A1M6F622_9FIRM|nr:1-deoxy-D-xylulose-5-phosphate synthase [Lutispora thermophila]SHI93039.1 1-deoxy-D-xylulose-5-phosphate synthase [Lutispora thermophila DSM 19022]